MKDSFEFNYGSLKEKSLLIASNKKYQWAATIILFVAVLLFSSSIRLSNWDLLTDQTTGEKIPLALDPFYFLRVSETIVENGGSLPEKDLFRVTAQGGAPWTGEILPDVMAFMYKVASTFSKDITLREVVVFSPVFFFVIGLIAFFALAYVLSKSKMVALLSSSFLAFSPAYLYRTLAGFSDHEALGMVSVFLCLLIYSLYLKDASKSSFNKIGLFSILTGIFTALVLATWGGAFIFILMVIPASFLLYWVLDDSQRENKLLFYFMWVISFFLFSLLFGIEFSSLIGRLSGSYAILAPFVAVFIISDFFVSTHKKLFRKYIVEKYEKLYSLGLSFLVGFLGLSFIGNGPLYLLKDIWIRIFSPLGDSRVGATVAENSQPYLNDLISQIGGPLFGLFFFGLLFIGFIFSRNVVSAKGKVLFLFSWFFFVSSTLFSRISSSHLLDGSNFLSQSIYVACFILFGFVFAKLYFDNEFEGASPLITLLFSLAFFVMISARSSIRTFFLIAPFISFIASNFLVALPAFFKEKKQSDWKALYVVVILLSLSLTFFIINDYEQGVSSQAKFTGPSANSQWQHAMSWVRENTAEDSIFLHWWDYGYWVQTLGERPSVTDGGHAAGNFGDHMIGRYVLTSQDPQATFSFMKTWDVSYLLLDPTDVGKYPAYSSIGSDSLGKDRFSSIPLMLLDSRQTVETSSGTNFVYSGGVFVDEDIIYNLEGQEIFLPQDKAALLGIVMPVSSDTQSTSFSQPTGVFVYNNQRYNIPLRYIYFNGELLDFGSGVESTLRVIPSFDGSSINVQGVVAYLSPKVSKGLFAKIYFLDDPFNEYEGVRLVHSEDNQVIVSMKAQGVDVGEFIYFQGFRGPLKIFEIEYPEETIKKEEFLRRDGEYAEFDNLVFTN